MLGHSMTLKFPSCSAQNSDSHMASYICTGAEPRGVEGGHLPSLAPPKKSINISSIILYNTINAFKNYINKWLINRMVF